MDMDILMVLAVTATNKKVNKKTPALSAGVSFSIIYLIIMMRVKSLVCRAESRLRCDHLLTDRPRFHKALGRRARGRGRLR